MMIYDHIDLRVRKLSAAKPLYDAILPALGLTEINADDESASYYPAKNKEKNPFVWITEAAEHQPGLTRIAFAANSRRDVDRLADTARRAGARAIEGPEHLPDYSENYYAVFFEDIDGNRFEICNRG